MAELHWYEAHGHGPRWLEDQAILWTTKDEAFTAASKIRAPHL